MPMLGGNTRAPRPRARGFARPSTGRGTMGPAATNYSRPGAGGGKTGGITDRSTKPKKRMAGVPIKKIGGRPAGPPKAYVGAREQKARQQFKSWMPQGQQGGQQQMTRSSTPAPQGPRDALASQLGAMMGSTQNYAQPAAPVQQFSSQAQAPPSPIAQGNALMPQPRQQPAPQISAQQQQFRDQAQAQQMQQPIQAQPQPMQPQWQAPQMQQQFNPYQQQMGMQRFNPWAQMQNFRGYGRY